MEKYRVSREAVSFSCHRMGGRRVDRDRHYALPAIDPHGVYPAGFFSGWLAGGG